jgi:c-di-GMP-binding flagellar brake protein YcgR
MPRQTGPAERRRHHRVPGAIPFHLLADGKDEPFDLMDLSESGVRISAPRALAPMTRIQVRMILPARRVGAKTDVALDLSGVVVWSHKEPKVSAYDVGVFFADLDDRQRNLLRAFVGSHA